MAAVTAAPVLVPLLTCCMQWPCPPRLPTQCARSTTGTPAPCLSRCLPPAAARSPWCGWLPAWPPCGCVCVHAPQGGSTGSPRPAQAVAPPRQRAFAHRPPARLTLGRWRALSGTNPPRSGCEWRSSSMARSACRCSRRRSRRCPASSTHRTPLLRPRRTVCHQFRGRWMVSCKRLRRVQTEAAVCVGVCVHACGAAVRAGKHLHGSTRRLSVLRPEPRHLLSKHVETDGAVQPHAQIQQQQLHILLRRRHALHVS